MNYSESKSFSIDDYKKESNKKDSAFFKFLVLPNVILLAFCFIWVFASGKFHVDSIYLPLILVILAIIGVRILVSKLLKIYSKRVHFLNFKKDQLTLKFKKGFSEDSATLSIHSSVIELRERRNAKSFLVGLQIILNDRISGANYVLYDYDWSSQSLERSTQNLKYKKAN
jgi:hypothetical protein